MRPLLHSLGTKFKALRNPQDELVDVAIELEAEGEEWRAPGIVAKRPEDIIAFQSLSEAIDFIAECLETDAVVSLATEIESLETRLNTTPYGPTGFLEGIFMPLQEIHAEKDLRRLYRGREFSDDDPGLALGGHLSELGSIHIFFVKRDRGWVIRDIWLTRKAPVCF
jgi:hypothetical protein